MTNLEKVQMVLMAELGLRIGDVAPEQLLAKLSIDSLELEGIRLELEDEFSIEISDEDMQKLYSVQDIVNYADSHCHA